MAAERDVLSELHEIDQETIVDINRYMFEAELIHKDGGQQLYGQRLRYPFLAITDRLLRAITLTNVLEDPLCNSYRGKLYEMIGDYTQQAPLVNAAAQARDNYKISKDFYGLISDKPSIERVRLKIRTLVRNLPS